MDADIRILSEFLSCLQTDSVRGSPSSLSLSSAPSVTKTSRRCSVLSGRRCFVHVTSEYTSRLRSINQPLRLLIETEMFRLQVWGNPTNDPKRGTDHSAAMAFQVSVQSLWLVPTIETRCPGCLGKYYTDRLEIRSRNCDLHGRASEVTCNS